MSDPTDPKPSSGEEPEADKPEDEVQAASGGSEPDAGGDSASSEAAGGPPPHPGETPQGDAGPPAHPGEGSNTAPAGSTGASVPLGGGTLSEKDEKMFAMLAHLLGILTAFVGPLIIWLIKKDESPFVDDQGKEALNFQITVTIAGLVLGVASGAGLVCITGPLWLAVWIAAVVFGILACMKANEGVAYRYPVALRLVS